MTTFRYLLTLAALVAMCMWASQEFGLVPTFLIACSGAEPMKKRIFARGIKKFVTVEMVNDNSGEVEAADLTLLEDDTNPVMTMNWRLEGKDDIGRALQAIQNKDLSGLMDVLDGYTGTLPLMQVEPEFVAND